MGGMVGCDYIYGAVGQSLTDSLAVCFRAERGIHFCGCIIILYGIMG